MSKRGISNSIMTEQEFNKYILGVRGKLIRFASGFSTSGAATPDDMVQDAILKVWKLSRYEGNQKVRNLEALTVIILKNVCLDYIRLKKNNNLNIDGAKEGYFKQNDGATPLQNLEIKERMEMVKSYIKYLPAEQQVVLKLRDVMGYELSEIAEILETTEGNVRTMLSRARGKMRGYLLGIEK